VTAFGWPGSAEELEALQRELAEQEPPSWTPDPNAALVVAGVFVASATGVIGTGAAGDPLWAAAVALDTTHLAEPIASAVVRGLARGPYVPGLLALREGELLEQVVRSLDAAPDVVLVNGTGRDHPRRAGIALHLGAVLGVPTLGVTVRPLVATPAELPPERGAHFPLALDEEVVGAVLRTRRGAHPVYLHAGWRTDADVARDLVLRCTGGSRTPEPIRLARRLARLARARDEGRLGRPPGLSGPRSR
jgi:deoxyribonuclease V